MRIALFTECYHPIVNGVVISIATFTRELRRQGHEVEIYAPAYPGHRDEDPQVHRLTSLALPTRPRYPLALPYSSARVWPHLAARPPDVVHSQHPFLAGREARRVARRLGRPLILTYHTLLRWYAHYVPLPRPLVEAMAVWVSRQYANSADRVVVPTRSVGQLLRSYGVRQPIHAVPTGVDLELLRSTPRTPVRGRFGIPEGAPVVAYSGRLAKEKNLDLLISAFAQVAQKRPEARLLLIGDGPWRERCEQLAASLGMAARVHITGYLPHQQVFDCLAEAQVFAFPSLTDTQGVAVLEAMAVGCPPVAVRSGAVVDVIRDQQDGLVVAPTAEGMAEALEAVLASGELRARLAGQARRRAEDFSAAAMADRLVGVYRQALSG